MATQRQPGTPYVIPKRFGMRSMLVITTLFGLLFAAAKWVPQQAVALFFYSSFVLVISLTQIVVPRVPRFASMLAGAVFLPLVVLGASLAPGGAGPFLAGILPRMSVEHELLWLVVIGGFLGYLSGVLLAGAVLVSDGMSRGTRALLSLTGRGGKREGPA